MTGAFKPLYLKFYEALPSGVWLNAHGVFNAVGRDVIRWPWAMHMKLDQLVGKKMIERRGEKGSYQWRKPVPIESLAERAA